MKNSHLDRDLFFNPSKIITFKVFPQPDRFSCTLLVFLIAVSTHYRISHCTISTAFQSTGCVELTLFLRVGTWYSYSVFVVDNSVFLHVIGLLCWLVYSCRQLGCECEGIQIFRSVVNRNLPVNMALIYRKTRILTVEKLRPFKLIERFSTCRGTRWAGMSYRV